MSDIGILNDPFSILFLLVLFGAPGLPLGAVLGALLWRKHRVIGGLLGALAGFALCLVSWFYLSGNL